MKRLLCMILALVCVLSFSSCNLLDKFTSTEPDAKPTATTPNVTEPDNKPTTPQGQKVDPTRVSFTTRFEGETKLMTVTIKDAQDGEYLSLGDFIVYVYVQDVSKSYDELIKEAFSNIAWEVDGAKADANTPVFNGSVVSGVQIPYTPGGDSGQDNPEVDISRVDAEMISSTDKEISFRVIIKDATPSEHSYLYLFISEVLAKKMNAEGMTFDSTSANMDWYLNDHIALADAKICHGDIITAKAKGSGAPTDVITVSVVFQSGGIHRVEETFKVEDPCTFAQVYSEFIKKHYLESFLLIPYLNDQPVDINETIYLQDGDRIYLEEYSGMPGDEPVCPHVWISGSCERCGAVCEHNEWDGNRQCLVCGTSLGVDLIYIEFYMDGEYYGCTSTIEYTVGEQLMFQFWRPWEDLTSTYDVYVGDLLVTDQSYMIVESCNIYLVTRTYDYQ